MTDEDDYSGLDRQIRLLNKGYGGIFNYGDSNDKCYVETKTIEEWRRTLLAEFKVQTGTPQYNPNDPPDFFISAKGKLLSVELVQLVDQGHKRRATKDETPYAGQLFKDMQWTDERLIKKLNEIIFKKGNKYQKTGIEIDVLLIHTAEPWLTSHNVRLWLNTVSAKQHSSIRSVFLLFRYEPGHGVNHWPLLCVYGSV